MPKIKKTSDSFKTSTRLPGLQYRNSRGLGATIDGMHREIDAAFVGLEAEIASNSDAKAALIKKGTVTILSDATSAATATGLGLGQWSTKPFILQRTDGGGAVASTRFTAIVGGNGDITISARNDAGALTVPGNGVDVTISWLVDAR